MMKGSSKDSSTGWTAYVRAYKEKYPDIVINFKTLMQSYIKGEPV